MNQDTIFLLPVFIIFVLAYIVWYVASNPPRKFLQAIKSDGEKPYHIRELTTSEKQFLLSYINRAKLCIIFSFPLVVMSLGYLVHEFVFPYARGWISQNAIFSWFAVCISIPSIYFLFSGYDAYQRYTSDIQKNSVVRVTGKLFKVQRTWGLQMFTYAIMVQNIFFLNFYPTPFIPFRLVYPKKGHAFDRYENGDTITIEYSPSSKHIWHIPHV